MKFKKYKCLPNIEVSEIINCNKSFNEIEIPKGCRLIKIQEIITLLESEEENEFLGDYKNRYSYFLTINKNESVRGVGRYGGGDWGAGWYLPGNSGSVGRVVFVKEDKQ